MIIDTKQIITVTEANQNFSRATRIADEKGSALVRSADNTLLCRGA